MTRRAFALWAVVALLWANLPVLIGYASSTSDNRFGGFYLYEQDGYSYLAKMRLGAHGAWDFHLPYTSEDEYQTGGLVYPFYLILGKLPLDPAFVYHAARLIGGLGLLIALYRLLTRFISDQRWQLWAWWLLLFSGGWGLLYSFIDPRYVAYELVAPDASIFSMLYGPPHIVIGAALLLMWIDYTLDSFQADRAQLPQRLLIANGLGALTALSREAYGPAFAGIFAAYLIALALQRRAIPWRESFIVALSSITAGAYGIYLIIAFRTSPGLAAWSAQNEFTSPALIDLLLGFAPLILLAGFGLWLFRSHAPRTTYHREASLWDSFLVTRYSSLLLAWLLISPIMAYLPIEISRRLIVGWQIPLSIFAAYGLLQLWRRRRVFAAAASIIVLPATFLIIMGGTTRVMAQQPPLYQSADELAALNWLGANTTDRDAVLSDWRFGNLVPIYADARVFIGHPIETIDFKTKPALVDQFFTSADSAQRHDLIQRWHITLIAAGADRVLADFPVAFQSGRYTLYRAVP
ncbi:MAG: hypothetical protein HY870_22055 [Chloroflexi bacterium]|nr:hypothetical protein [Chloroflexota bacterium]